MYLGTFKHCESQGIYTCFSHNYKLITLKINLLVFVFLLQKSRVAPQWSADDDFCLELFIVRENVRVMALALMWTLMMFLCMQLRFSLDVIAGYGLCGAYQGVHHRSFKPLWAHTWCSCWNHLEIQSSGKRFLHCITNK